MRPQNQYVIAAQRDFGETTLLTDTMQRCSEPLRVAEPVAHQDEFGVLDAEFRRWQRTFGK